jgi:hypothetical protein
VVFSDNLLLRWGSKTGALAECLVTRGDAPAITTLAEFWKDVPGVLNFHDGIMRKADEICSPKFSKMLTVDRAGPMRRCSE